MFEKLQLSMRLDWLHAAYKLSECSDTTRAARKLQQLHPYVFLCPKATTSTPFPIQELRHVLELPRYDSPSGENYSHERPLQNLNRLANDCLQIALRSVCPPSSSSRSSDNAVSLSRWFSVGGGLKAFRRVLMPHSQMEEGGRKFIRAYETSSNPEKLGGNGARFDWVRVKIGDATYACRVNLIFSLTSPPAPAKIEQQAASSLLLNSKFLLIEKFICSCAELSGNPYTPSWNTHRKDLSCLHPKAGLPVIARDSMDFYNGYTVVQLDQVVGGAWVVDDYDNSRLKWVLTNLRK